MAVKINVATTTIGGLTLPSGAIVVFKTELAPIAYQIKLTFDFFKDAATVIAQGESTQSIVGVGNKFTKDVSMEQFNSISIEALESLALNYIESVVGTGNCETIARSDLQPSGGPT